LKRRRIALKLLIDESVDFRIASKLKNSEFEVVFVSKNFKCLTDMEVLELAKRQKAIILTEDKDFAEWAFAYKDIASGVVLLDYNCKKFYKIPGLIIYSIKKYGKDLYKKLCVITHKNVEFKKNLVEN